MAGVTHLHPRLPHCQRPGDGGDAAIGTMWAFPVKDPSSKETSRGRRHHQAIQCVWVGGSGGGGGPAPDVEPTDTHAHTHSDTQPHANTFLAV